MPGGIAEASANRDRNIEGYGAQGLLSGYSAMRRSFPV